MLACVLIHLHILTFVLSSSARTSTSFANFLQLPLLTRGFGSGDVKRESDHRSLQIAVSPWKILWGRIGATSGLGAVSMGRWIVSADGTRCMVAAAIFKLLTQH